MKIEGIYLLTNVQLNEQTPLLREINNHSVVPREEPQERTRRDITLAEIVNFTGQNLIDVTSISQPEVRTIGKSANEYKRILAELRYAGSNGSTSTSPTNSMTTSHTVGRNGSTRSKSGTMSSSILPKRSSSLVTEQDRTWLKNLGSSASRAVQEEPVVKAVGNLVLSFK